MPSYRLRERVVLRGRAKDMCGRRGRDGGRGVRCCDGSAQGVSQLARLAATTLEVMLKVALVLWPVRALSPRAQRLPRSTQQLVVHIRSHPMSTIHAAHRAPHRIATRLPSGNAPPP